jgi:beta-glucosidase
VLNLTPVYPASGSEADAPQARWTTAPRAGTATRSSTAELPGRHGLAHLGADAPQVQPGDLAAIAQPLDFLGINYYSRHVASASGPWDVKPRPASHRDGLGGLPRRPDELLLRLHRDYQPLPAC